MTRREARHARIALYSFDSLSHKTNVECRCGWNISTGSRWRAVELYREHKKDADRKEKAGTA